MIRELIRDTQKRLPFQIENHRVDMLYFIISGKGWSFVSVSKWRIIRNNRIILSCYDKTIKKEIDSLIGLSIIKIGIQSTEIGIDPVLYLSDGAIIEIFSTTCLEPWIFNYDDVYCFTIDPGDPRDVDLIK